MRKKIVDLLRRALKAAGRNWMESMQYYSLQL